ncbi:very-short-patch-repair endonuclease [Acidovorax sp. 107]|uniref:DUF2726 domain-containing protein n=1 Tax=Acidovorax sp. 107 TaxID=2135638 RepID=UPI000D39126D|nr:DUF2726 domain-containing protein [Acidovorax sp. 107]PUA99145.1 very-short-patch-repair endonuclease [Acidovorax sp. 107]
MKTLIFLVVLVLIAAIVIAALKKKSTETTTDGEEQERPKRKRLLTQREEAMYNRLTTSLPESKILAQVSFGALLSAKSRATRNSFDRKIADFVVCDKSLQVLAVIELDDDSHKKKTEEDAARDALLTNAGYRVIRYGNIPDTDQLQRDFPLDKSTLKGAKNAVNNDPIGTSPIDAASAVLARKTEPEQERTS